MTHSGRNGEPTPVRTSHREFDEVERRQDAYYGFALYHDKVMHMFIEHLLTRIRNRSCWLTVATFGLAIECTFTKKGSSPAE